MPIIKLNNKEFPISEIYQNVFGTDIMSERDCYDRLRTIITADRSFNNSALENSTVCDIGSNLGYFLFKLSEINKNKMLGVEIDSNAYNVSREIGKDFDNILFANCGYQNIENLDYESYLCLSIFHHNLGEGFKFLNKISDHARTIYVEQATHLEWAYFSKNMKCGNENPYVFWLNKLNEVTDYKFNIRLIGTHRTHLNTIRPMYQLKRKISKEIQIEGIPYIIYDTFNIPYLEFGINRVSDMEKPICLPRNKTYMFGYQKNTNFEVFIKEENMNYIISQKHDGFLLSDIMRWGMLPFYNKYKLRNEIKSQLAFPHSDATPWNFIVDKDSNVFSIDFNDNLSFIKQPYLIDLILNLI